MCFCDIEEIKRAGLLLKKGEVVAFPTETVYGLGVRFDDLEAYKKLVAIKRRPPEKPFSVMCSSLEEAFALVDISEQEKRVMERFMPGEITVLVKAKDSLPFQATLGNSVIGIRVPNSKIAIEVLLASGSPCLVTSANRSGEPFAKSYDEVEAIFKNEISFTVHGECFSKRPSTIVDMSKRGTIELIREGSLSFKEVEAVFYS